MPRRNYKKSAKKTPNIAPGALGLASTPDVACRQKQRFPTEKQAKYAAETKELADHKLQLDTYHCPWCGGWHLTSKTVVQLR